MKKTSCLNLVSKAVQISFINIWRNKILSIATISVIGIIIFIFNIILAVNFITNDTLSSLGKKVDLVIYLKESTSYQQALNISKEISTLEGIEEVKYTTKNDALNQLKQTHPELILAFEKYELGNPLPASLSIKTSHPRYHKTISEFLSRDNYTQYLSNVSTSDKEENSQILTSVTRNLLELTNFANQVIFWLIITFIVGGALIILNGLQMTIYSRKKEISVMKMVGASHWFIRLPFIIESIIYGVLAVVVSFILIFMLSKNIYIKETSIWSYYTNIKFQTIFLVELIFTVTLSIISSLIAVHEYLKNKI
ncbi:FtsX-like permease family protein [Candidatus Peregrinibacteria bacterium]|nr:FtsX-like permease family protein [Candidatus Peregrinibacteria bacterium]